MKIKSMPLPRHVRQADEQTKAEWREVIFSVRSAVFSLPDGSPPVMAWREAERASGPISARHWESIAERLRGRAGAVHPPAQPGINLRLNHWLGVKCSWCLRLKTKAAEVGGCIACSTLRDAWAGATTAVRAALVPFVRAAMNGDPAAAYAASDWISDEFSIPNVGLWWPAILSIEEEE